MTESTSISALAKRALLRPHQIQDVKRSISQAEDVLSKHDFLRNVHGLDINVEEVEQTLKRDKQTLELGSPQEYANSTRNKLFKTMRDLEGKITFDMPTLDEMERPTPVNIDKHMAWEKVHKEDILAWKTIRRTLAPDNDGTNFTNIETLRTNTPPKGDPRKYWSGFDNIKWEAEVEDDLVSNLDDQQYLSFLELRALDWTKPNIMRQLEWTEPYYNAALERFRRATAVTNKDIENIVRDDMEDEEPKKVKRTIVESEKWPIPQALDRGMTIHQLLQLSGVSQIRMARVCLSEKRPTDWRADEKEAIEAALQRWDDAKAFASADSADAPQEVAP